LRNRTFILGAILLVLTLAVDIYLFFLGLFVLGIFSLIGTSLVFSAAMFWFMHLEDTKFHFQKPVLIIPIAILGSAVALVFDQTPMIIQKTPENLEQIGNLMMSRYQIALWLSSAIVFFVFIISSSVLTKRDL
jgi:hypothetical protein